MATFKAHTNDNKTIELQVNSIHLTGDENLYAMQSQTSNTVVVVNEPSATVLVDNRDFKIQVRK